MLIALIRFTQSPGYKMQDIKRFFRVGVVLGKPWAWIENASDPLDIKFLDPSKKNQGLIGKSNNISGLISCKTKKANLF